METRNLAMLLTAGAILMSILAGACTSASKPSGHPYAGTVLDPPQVMEDFVLIDQHGQDFRLSDHLNPLALIFFGYTYCPDVCPTTLADMVRLKRTLGVRADDVTFLMVTVDPERDTPEVLGQRLALFDPAFVGLTGERAVLQRIWKDFGITVLREEVGGSATGYLIAHSAYLYLVDQERRLRLLFPFGTPPEDIAGDFVKILQR